MSVVSHVPLLRGEGIFKNFTDKILPLFCEVYDMSVSRDYKCLYTMKIYANMNWNITQYTIKMFRIDISNCVSLNTCLMQKFCCCFDKNCANQSATDCTKNTKGIA